MLLEERRESMARELGIDPEQQPDLYSKFCSFLLEADCFQSVKEISPAWGLPECVCIKVLFSAEHYAWLVVFDRRNDWEEKARTGRRGALAGASQSIIIALSLGDTEIAPNLSQRDIA